MNSIYRKIILVFSLLIIALISIILIIGFKNKKLNSDLSIAINNEKAFIEENNKLTSQNVAFKLSLEQLEYFKDSITLEMNNLRRILKIKDKEIKQMSTIISEQSKKDTIFLKDTIFRDSNFKLDTVLFDNWYKLQLGLQYPNIISVNPTFKDSLFIFAYNKKETIKPPKKCAFARLFQKKHNVIRVEVVNKNPYSEIKKQKFIIIE